MTDTQTKTVVTKPITSVETALRIYYMYPELENKHIRELFGVTAGSTVARYKAAVLDEQARRGVATMRLAAVDTAVAYDVWGIDIDDLERRRKKLKSLGMAS